MKAKLVRFGEIEVNGQRYDYDLVIEGGKISKRQKKASKVYRDRYGHTPLSAEEPIPWGGERIIIGTGFYGSLPIMPEVYEEAERRGVEVVAVKTEKACRMLRDLKDREVYAILHVTC